MSFIAGPEKGLGCARYFPKNMLRAPCSNRVLAVLLPLAVVSNRFLVHVGVFYNDFVVAVLALVLLARYPLRVPRRSLLCMAALFLFLAIHSAITASLHPDLGLTILFNFARMVLCIVELVAFYTFYKNIAVEEAVAGVRRAAWVLSGSILIHFVLLNCAGELGRSLGTWQEHELDGRNYDLQTVGFLRPRGIAMEPAFAAGYLFLMAAILRLAESRQKYSVSHSVFLFSALMTGSLSILLFLPVWTYLLFRSGQKRYALLTTAAVLSAAIFLAQAAPTQAGMVSDRARAIVQGEDLSASLRLVPMLRTFAGTLEQAPWSGFGIGQSRLADSAGSGRRAFSWLPEVESERYSGVVVAEMFGDFGIPGLLAFAALLYFCAYPGTEWRRSGYWLVCILLTQNCYVYRNPQLYYWCSLGLLIALGNRAPGWRVLPCKVSGITTTLEGSKPQIGTRSRVGGCSTGLSVPPAPHSL